MNKSIIETIAGLLVLLIAFFGIFIAYQNNEVSMKTDGYIIKAEFENIEGISIGSPVKISGLIVGEVVQYSLNRNNFYVAISMKINKDIKLPTDTSASVSGLGIIGSRYISLVPGAEDDEIANDGMIEYTSPPMDIESMIGKFIFGSSDKESNKKEHANHDRNKQDIDEIESDHKVVL